jgi:hypothetical protein
MVLQHRPEQDFARRLARNDHKRIGSVVTRCRYCLWTAKIVIVAFCEHSRPAHQASGVLRSFSNVKRLLSQKHPTCSRVGRAAKRPTKVGPLLIILPGAMPVRQCTALTLRALIRLWSISCGHIGHIGGLHKYRHTGSHPDFSSRVPPPTAPQRVAMAWGGPRTGN